MSIYGGFGTRQQESQYNYLVESIIRLLQNKAAGYIKGDASIEDSYKNQVINLYDAMVRLENHKYLDPKYSESFKDMVRVFKSSQRISVNESEIRTSTEVKTSRGKIEIKGGTSSENLSKTERMIMRSVSPINHDVVSMRRKSPFKQERNIVYTKKAQDLMEDMAESIVDSPKISETGFLYARISNF